MEDTPANKTSYFLRGPGVSGRVPACCGDFVGEEVERNSFSWDVLARLAPGRQFTDYLILKYRDPSVHTHSPKI